MQGLRKRPRIGEALIQGFLFFCGAVSILTTLGIVFELGKESLLFFQMPEVTLKGFLTGTEWQPTIGKFGVLPLVNATLMTSFIAMLVSLPLGLGAAIYLSEYATPRARSILKPILEVLAGVPTVVYGYFALTTMTPILRVDIWRRAGEYLQHRLGRAGDGHHDLPAGVFDERRRAQRGAPLAARSGVWSGRHPPGNRHAGGRPGGAFRYHRRIHYRHLTRRRRDDDRRDCRRLRAEFTFNPFNAAETMTGYIARISGGDLAYDTPDYNSIFAIGLLLFFITLVLNIVSRQLGTRFREVYE